MSLYGKEHLLEVIFDIKGKLIWNRLQHRNIDYKGPFFSLSSRKKWTDNLSQLWQMLSAFSIMAAYDPMNEHEHFPDLYSFLVGTVTVLLPLLFCLLLFLLFVFLLFLLFCPSIITCTAVWVFPIVSLGVPLYITFLKEQQGKEGTAKESKT